MNRKKILIGGASGFVGKALVEHFKNKGWKVVKLSREHRRGQVFWDIESAYVNPHSVSGFDAIISLAGENIFTRWTKQKKHKIIMSRINSAEAISRAISLSAKPPKVFLCASAIGYYGNTNGDEVDESSPAGNGFLAEVCKHWEYASHIAKTPDTRVVNMRFGVVLDENGGFFKLVKNFARAGIRLIFGEGSCAMSWISLSDLCNAIEFAVENNSISGAVNFTSPEPCTYNDLADALRTTTKYSISLGIPQWILRLLLGKISDEMIFADVRANPKKLSDLGFIFEDKNIFSFAKKISTNEQYNQNHISSTYPHNIKCVLKRK
jgi:uncharacterized protein (TIGR01777 family)